MTRAQLDHVINNVFLPPRLPSGADDSNIANDNDRVLCEFVLEVAEQFSGTGKGEGSAPASVSNHPERWSNVIRMLRHLEQNQPYPSSNGLLQSVRRMNQDGKKKSTSTTNPQYSRIALV